MGELFGGAGEGEMVTEGVFLGKLGSEEVGEGKEGKEEAGTEGLMLRRRTGGS